MDYTSALNDFLQHAVIAKYSSNGHQPPTFTCHLQFFHYHATAVGCTKIAARNAASKVILQHLSNAWKEQQQTAGSAQAATTPNPAKPTATVRPEPRTPSV